MDDTSPSLEPQPCSKDDTLRDLALAHRAQTDTPAELAPPAEELAPPSNRRLKKPLGYTDVFIDDFIQLGQGGHRCLKALRQHLLHAIDQILARPEVSDERRNEAVSLKKLLKGDGSPLLWCCCYFTTSNEGV